MLQRRVFFYKYYQQHQTSATRHIATGMSRWKLYVYLAFVIIHVLYKFITILTWCHSPQKKIHIEPKTKFWRGNNSSSKVPAGSMCLFVFVFFFLPQFGFPGAEATDLPTARCPGVGRWGWTRLRPGGGVPMGRRCFFTYKFTHKENRPTLKFLFLMIFTLGLVGRIWVKEVNFWRFKILTWDAQTVPRMHHHAGLCVFLVGIFINLHFPPQLRMVSILNCNRLILQVRG